MSEKKVRRQRQFDRIIDMLNSGKRDEAIYYMKVLGEERVRKISPFLEDIVQYYQ